MTTSCPRDRATLTDEQKAFALQQLYTVLTSVRWEDLQDKTAVMRAFVKASELLAEAIAEHYTDPVAVALAAERQRTKFRPVALAASPAGDERMFRVLKQETKSAMPRSVPWSFVEEFGGQVEYNHGQTLERLNERGGLAPEEMWLAAHGRSLREKIDESVAIAWLNEAVGEWHARCRNREVNQVTNQREFWKTASERYQTEADANTQAARELGRLRELAAKPGSDGCGTLTGDDALEWRRLLHLDGKGET